jgi:actin
MKKIFHHTIYNEFRLDPTEHPVLMTEAILTPKANPENTMTLIFDLLDTPAISVEIQVVLSLLNCG